MSNINIDNIYKYLFYICNERLQIRGTSSLFYIRYFNIIDENTTRISSTPQVYGSELIDTSNCDLDYYLENIHNDYKLKKLVLKYEDSYNVYKLLNLL